MVEISKVDWRAYAEVYDLMAVNNPAYQDLLTQFRSMINQWILEPQSTLVELGAGTGNFSIELARAFPECMVVHLDADQRMNLLAESKATAQKLQNIHFVSNVIQEVQFPVESLSAVVMVHALYTFPNPREVISKIFKWLIPGGYLFACDVGSVANVSDWATYLFGEWYRRHGLWRTFQLFYKGRVVTQQNRLIARAQREGVYWTHTSAEFREAFESARFEIITDQKAYRKTSDLIVARKPFLTRR
jgi:ubiquinone/menaquinone biosynthesis C-methylase UbiE